MSKSPAQIHKNEVKYSHLASLRLQVEELRSRLDQALTEVAALRILLKKAS